ncbi:hypothetical protein ACQ4PT_035236 [Festuca glaucescens]
MDGRTSRGLRAAEEDKRQWVVRNSNPAEERGVVDAAVVGGAAPITSSVPDKVALAAPEEDHCATIPRVEEQESVPPVVTGAGCEKSNKEGAMLQEVDQTVPLDSPSVEPENSLSSVDPIGQDLSLETGSLAREVGPARGEDHGSSARSLEEAFFQVSVSYDNGPCRTGPAELLVANRGLDANLSTHDAVLGSDGSVTSDLSLDSLEGSHGEPNSQMQFTVKDCNAEKAMSIAEENALGLQLALRLLTRAQWQPMIDAVVRIVPAWQRGLVTKPVRLVLVKAVMAARPVHHLLILEAPCWLIEEIYKGLRGFFWAGKDRANGGQCLVAWERVCKPLEFGGLGVKNLRLQGLALRVRWQWLQRTDLGRPWQGLPMIKDTQAWEVFDSLVRIKVGDGRSTLFWRDRWINGRAASDYAPGLCRTVSARTRNARTVAQGLSENAWITDFSGNLATRGVLECIALWVAVCGVSRDVSVADTFSWPWSAAGEYSARSTYDMLCQGEVRFPLSEAIWRCRATPKSKLFMWLAIQYRIWTSDQRARHGLQANSSACFVCLQEEDTADHILLQCVHARQVWLQCAQLLGIVIQIPTPESSMQAWWTMERGRFHGGAQKLFDTFVCTVSYALWKNRNAWCFGNTNKQLSVNRLSEIIIREFEDIRIARRVGIGVGVRQNITRE